MNAAIKTNSLFIIIFLFSFNNLTGSILLWYIIRKDSKIRRKIEINTLIDPNLQMWKRANIHDINVSNTNPKIFDME